MRKHVICVFVALAGYAQSKISSAAQPAYTTGRQLSHPTALVKARQLVLVSTADWRATTGILRRYARDAVSSRWVLVGKPVPVVIGRAGLAWSANALATSPDQPVKHEGDGKSPAGAFPLDTAFGFAPRAEASWIHLPYAPLTGGTDCVDDEKSASYNTVVDRDTLPRVDWTSAEHMRAIGAYRIGVIVGYNAAPVVPGRGSCIFLHIWSGPASSTAGCTALDASALEGLMRWLDASRHPAIVQLPAAELARLRSPWKLPPA